MKTERIEDVDKIIKKVTTTPFTAKFAFCIFILSFIGFLVGLFSVMTDIKLAIVLLIICGILSITFFLIYFFQKKGLKKKLKEIDIEDVKKELNEKVTHDDWNTTYFTEHYMLSNYSTTFIIKYTDILWVHDRDYVDASLNFVHHDIAIHLKNGKTEIVINHKDFIDEIVKHNNKVLVGKTKENKQKYKELLKEVNK